MNIWFIADPHFDHKNIIKYCERPFNTVEEMNQTLIERWNSVVKKDDKVFVLGDFSLCQKENTIKYAKSLKGRKTLILGNHDRLTKSAYYEAGFDFISPYPILWNEFFILSHAPKFTQENSVYTNIFGHIHNDPAYKDYSSNSFCVSVERINYTPINFEIIRKTIKEENK